MSSEEQRELSFVAALELPDRLDTVSAELVRRHQPDSPEGLDWQRPQELGLPIGLDDEQTVGLGCAARHLGEHLRPGDTDGDRQSDSLARAAPEALGDLPRRSRRSAPARARRGTPPPWRGPRRAGRSPRTGRTAPCSPPCRRRSGAERRQRAGRAAEPVVHPSRRGSRTRAPRSSPPSRLRRRRSSGGPAGSDRRAAPPRRRTRQRQRAGSTRGRTRTYVRIRDELLGERRRALSKPDTPAFTPKHERTDAIVGAGPRRAGSARGGGDRTQVPLFEGLRHAVSRARNWLGRLRLRVFGGGDYEWRRS